MSVASAARSAGLVQERPLRYPDASSHRVMDRRAVWLVILNFLLPGSAQVLAGSRRLGRFGLGATIALWALVVLGLLGTLIWRPGVLALVTNWFPLLLLQLLLIGYAVLWLVLTIDTLRLVRLVKLDTLPRIGVLALAVVLGIVSTGSAGWAAQTAGTTRDTLGTIFQAAGPSVAPSNGYYNILLLGADSGEGRDSMRFDSISVVSINADTGATTIVGIPRELANAPFSEGSPMRELYPDGFHGHASQTCGWNGWMNHIRQAAEQCRSDHGDSLYPDARKNASSPGVEATKDAAEGILGIEIPLYVFIDMDGFAALVDALGGVDITVAERLPKGGGPAYQGQRAEDWAIGWIEAGPQHMDGDTSQWYARSRYTTSDWDRMLRQRQLQEALLAQFTPTNVLTRFQEVAAAGTHLVETDIPQSMVSFFAELAIKAKGQPVTTIELTPKGAGITQEDPDFAYIHELVQKQLYPPTPTPAPEG